MTDLSGKVIDPYKSQGKKMKKISRILLDMDLVLADFVYGVCRAWEVHPLRVYSEWVPGTYRMDAALGTAVGLGRPTTSEEYWGKIESVPGFWLNLPELPWCRELLDFVRTKTDDWYVVTSPSRCPTCIPEKREWMRRVLGLPEGEWYSRLIPTPHKELLAKPGVLLIDDYDENVDRFRREGGTAIVFPSHGNSLHRRSHDPMEWVKTALPLDMLYL